MGLLPEGANVTGNLSVTLALAGCTLVLVNWHGSKEYWKHIFAPPGIPKIVYLIIIPIEVMGIFIRPITMALRLFANMLAGHLALLSILSILFTLGKIGLFVVIPLGTGFIVLKIFVSLIQAYVFTLLSAMALGNAVATH